MRSALISESRNAENHFAKFCCAESLNAECLNAENCYAAFHCAECRKDECLNTRVFNTECLNAM